MPKVAVSCDVVHGNSGRGNASGKSTLSIRSSAQTSNNKAKFCMYHLQGVCKYKSSACAFAHSMEEMEGARRARKGQSAGGKHRLAADWCSESSSEGMPDKAGIMNHLVEHHWSSVDPKPATSGLQNAAGVGSKVWPELEEPMFVETCQQPLRKHDVADALHTYATADDVAMPRDAERYLGSGLAPLYARLRAELAKTTTEDLGTGLAARLVQSSNSAKMLQESTPHTKGSSDQGCKNRPVFTSADVLGPGAAGVPLPTFYAVPNPFIALSERKVTHYPPPGLDLSRALGA